MAKIKLNTADQLKRFLNLVVEESISEAMPSPVQDEESQQAQTAKDLKPFHVKPGSKKKDQAKDDEKDPDQLLQQEEESEESIEEPVTLAGEDVPEVTVRKVIDRLNILRSGKSLKDKKTLTNFTEYFNSLEGGEKQALFAFLDGISTILAGGDEAETATDPADWGVQVKPALKNDRAGNAKKQKSDDSPIVVGEAADKTKILKRMLALRG
jgi:hypothetical protein